MSNGATVSGPLPNASVLIYNDFKCRFNLTEGFFGYPLLLFLRYNFH